MAEISTYKEAGVDIDKADAFIRSIRPLVRSTYRTGVLGEIGAFGGLFHLGVDKYRDPVLVSATDGVGTKIRIAVLMDRHDTIGIDLVAMCVNDIIVHGATPLFFLDYLAMGRLATDTAIRIIEGVTHGCRQARCSLIGGRPRRCPASTSPGLRPGRVCGGGGGAEPNHRRLGHRGGSPGHRPGLQRPPLQRLLPGAPGPLRA